MSVKPEFFEPIEGLRGVAAILVALIHLQIFDNFITKSIFVSKADLAVDLFLLLVVLLLLIITKAGSMDLIRK